jgi:choline dehydrogenase-like flavoprotein
MSADFDDLAAVTFDNDDGSVVVIVGSGAGGGTLANELAQKGIDVVVLEAGPRFQAPDFANDEYAMSEKLSWRDKRICTGSSPIAENFSDAPTWVCKGVGGSTLHWTGTCVRFQDFEFSARTTYGAIPGSSVADWPIGLADLAPYYDRADDKMGVTGTNGIPFHPPGNNFKVLAAGARRVGYRQVDTNRMAINSEPRDGRNACDHIGFCMQGCRSGAKWSTANAELPKAEATGRCEVRPECMALRIEHDARGRAAGVLYVDASGERHSQKARAVCVAGNAIETPRLLLNSESSAFPDGLANGSGLVGKNYMRHVFAYLYAQFERPVSMHRGIPVAGAIRDESRFDPSRGFAGSYLVTTAAYGLPFFSAFLDPLRWGRAYTSWIDAYDHTACSVVVGEDMAMETNRVVLHESEKDQYGLAIPWLHLDDHPNDFALKNYSTKKLCQVYDAVGARRVREGPTLPSSHNLGTCRMSARPEDGVVDKWGRAHEVANLYVSDGSQFASSMGGNPTLTIVALAIRQADHIAEAMARGEL